MTTVLILKILVAIIAVLEAVVRIISVFTAKLQTIYERITGTR